MRLPDFIYLRRPGARILSALILALIVGGVVVLARLFGHATQSSTPDVAGASPKPVTTTAGDDSVYATSSASANAVPSAALRVGEEFVRAWLQPTDGRTQASWYAGLKKYASPGLATQMRDVDPSTNPATKVTGAVTGTEITPDSAKVVVPTNAGPATTLCVRAAAGWQVATIDLGE